MAPIVAAVMLARTLLALSGKGQPRGPVRVTANDFVLLTRIGAAGGAAIAALVGWAFAGEHGWLSVQVATSWVVALGFAALVSPGYTARQLFVPFGLARTAWAFEWATGGAIRKGELRARGPLLAAMALARQRRPSEALIRRVERHLATNVELRGTGIAAEAMLALARGDRDRARLLCASIDGVALIDVDNTARCLARDVLTVDAAERGDWKRVLDVASRRPRGRTTRLMERVAFRLIGSREMASRTHLWEAWLFAPERMRTWPLVRQALAAPEPPPPPVGGEALATHRELLALGPQLASTDVIGLGAARVDALRDDSAALATVARRALALETTVDPASIRDALVRSLEDDLTQLALASRVSLRSAQTGATIAAVRARVREERFARLTSLVQDAERRRRDRADLSEADEWCAFQSIRTITDDLWADAEPAERPAVFNSVYATMCNVAVRIENVRGRRWLARVMFEWLLPMAMSGGTRESVTLLTGNSSSCISDRLPYSTTLEGERLGGGARSPRAVLAVTAVTATLFAGIVLGARLLGEGLAVCLSMVTIIGGVFVGLAVLGGRRWPVEAVLTPDGLVLQRAHGRWNAPFEDISTVRRSKLEERAVIVDLARSPDWLGSSVAILATTSAEAIRIQERIASSLEARRKARAA